MHSCLRCISIQSLAVCIPRQAIHNRPGHRTRLIDLQSKIIMHASDWMVMLMYDKMSPVGALISTVEVGEILDG